mmetsp:Transcript_44674/g.72727  ORF Transcript_44674/g.72727 Transcript_44674/m.72727 type:complete len:103 (-) Transcript_44674:12-320(-)
MRQRRPRKFCLRNYDAELKIRPHRQMYSTTDVSVSLDFSFSDFFTDFSTSTLSLGLLVVVPFLSYFVLPLLSLLRSSSLMLSLLFSLISSFIFSSVCVCVCV